MNHVILSLIYYLSCSKILKVNATSMKMDFLPLGDVRTDPIINPDCLSDHVHTFYGKYLFSLHSHLVRFRCVKLMFIIFLS